MDPQPPVPTTQMQRTAEAEQTSLGWWVTVFLVGAISGAFLESEVSHRRRRGTSQPRSGWSSP